MRARYVTGLVGVKPLNPFLDFELTRQDMDCLTADRAPSRPSPSGSASVGFQRSTTRYTSHHCGFVRKTKVITEHDQQVQTNSGECPDVFVGVGSTSRLNSPG